MHNRHSPSARNLSGGQNDEVSGPEYVVDRWRVGGGGRTLPGGRGECLRTLAINAARQHHIGCMKRRSVYHSGNVSSSSVNGDIAFLWEWSNFDHS